MEISRCQPDISSRVAAWDILYTSVHTLSTRNKTSSQKNIETEKTTRRHRRARRRCRRKRLANEQQRDHIVACNSVPTDECDLRHPRFTLRNTHLHYTETPYWTRIHEYYTILRLRRTLSRDSNMLERKLGVFNCDLPQRSR